MTAFIEWTEPVIKRIVEQSLGVKFVDNRCAGPPEKTGSGVRAEVAQRSLFSAAA